jgi:DNA-binding NarL/FixJ family response regulator
MSHRILIVEDEPLVALELKETLEQAGFEVPPTVDSADLVIQAVRSHEPSLILMDIRLRSFLDGIDVVSRVRLLSEIPVVYLTAYSTPEVVHRAEGTHPAAFLVKPVDGALLVGTLERILNPAPEASAPL